MEDGGGDKRQRRKGKKKRGGKSKGPVGGRELVLSKEAMLARLDSRGGKVTRVITIDFESFFETHPSEVALCAAEVATGRIVATWHAFIAPSFVVADLSESQLRSLQYVQGKVTGIPPHLSNARRDYAALLQDIVAFVAAHDVDGLGMLFAKACTLESKALLWLGRDRDVGVELPALAEVEDLMEHFFGRPLAKDAFNVLVKRLPFRLSDCCSFHHGRNRPLVDKNQVRVAAGREPNPLFHCALQVRCCALVSCFKGSCRTPRRSCGSWWRQTAIATP